MGELIIFFAAPMHLISKNKPAHRRKAAIRELEEQLECLDPCQAMARMEIEQADLFYI